MAEIVVDLDRVRDLVAELAPRPRLRHGLRPGTLLVDDLEYHSLALAELAIAIGDTFGLDVEDPKALGGLLDLRTVADLEDLITRLVIERSS